MQYCLTAQTNPFHKAYHDEEYGFPCEGDDELFELLCLEINQAGLSWLTVLKKRLALRQAFERFNIASVANFDEDKRQQLLTNANIIRNRLKVQAVVHNAQVLQGLIKQVGSFRELLDEQQKICQLDLQSWVRWFRQHFKFVGEEIVNEFLMSSGYLPGAHASNCPVFEQVLKRQPPWLKYVNEADYQ